MHSLSRYEGSGSAPNANRVAIEDGQTLRPQTIEPWGRDARSKWSVLDMLNRIGCGYLILNRYGNVIEWNAVALAQLQVLPETSDLVSPCRGDRPTVLQEDVNCGPEETSIVVLLDRYARLEPKPRTLQQMFRLTGAETQVALRMARGESPIEIARSSKLSPTTIRSQLASLFAKTETNRQSDLVALLYRVAVLP
jgi:DNA-binding CsgD family transcriptional regulator